VKGDTHRVRRRVPPVAWVLFAGTLGALTVALFPHLRAHGVDWYFRAGDPVFFRAVATDPFGSGHMIVALGRPGDAAYRYGRIGFPLLGWLFALGHPAAVGWTMAFVHMSALAAVPALAAVLLDTYGARPALGALVLLAPGLLLVADRAYGEPLLIATLLLGYIFEARGKRGAAVVAFAFAMLVKETAILGVVPLVWRDARRPDWRGVWAWSASVVPFIGWMVWVRVRVGEFPFLAPTHSRRDALRPPFVGIAEALKNHTPDAGVVVSLTLATLALCLAAAWLGRGLPVAGAALAFAAMVVCLGPNALAYLGETLRLIAVPQVFSVLALTIAATRRRAGTAVGNAAA
jgi:hypothetical protein